MIVDLGPSPPKYFQKIMAMTKCIKWQIQSILKNVSTSYVHTHHGVATSEVDGMD